MKVCFKCQESKPLGEFYKHKMMADGHLGKCKECTKKDVRRDRLQKLDYYRAYDKAREKTERRFEQKKRQLQKYRANYPQKNQARAKVAMAIRSGILERRSCEDCGSHKNIHAHHEDYSRPLDVVWLCVTCHLNRHHRIA